MEVKNCGNTLVFLFTFFGISNSSVLSGLAGLGYTPLKHDVCDRDISDDHRTCYTTVATNISCFTVTLQMNACKTHADSYPDDKVAISKPRNLTYLQAYYHRFDGGRHRQGIAGSCAELSQSNCTQYRCERTCCSGWEMDESGQCNRRSSSLCKNGGTYDYRMHRCMCTQGFSGEHCEIALCHRGCLHGGHCTPTFTGNNACLCPPHASGSYCQILRCPQKCENGGYCISDGPIATCKCPRGFYGKTCAHSYRGDTLCPAPNTTLCTDLGCKDDCAADSECSSGQVCCTDGCCMKCVKPRSPGCLHNGIVYKHFDWFRTDNCTSCVCRRDGTVSCFTVPTYDSSLCCFPYCKDNKTPGTHTTHRAPTINCSNVSKVVPVSRYSAVADMSNLNIHAKDQNGHTLKVSYSPSSVTHDKTTHFARYPDIITASAKDIWRQTAICYQLVFVVDQTPPIFYSCPSDVYATDSELVSWRTPRARDNVGVRSLKSNYKPYRHFQSGLSMVVYTATDYDDNKAFCQFYVHVTLTKTDITPPRFISCPDVVYGTEGEAVSWREPRVSDNGGIRAFVSTHYRNSLFPPGVTTVTYTATDHAGNKAYCRFNVKVTPKDTDSQSSKSHTTDSVKITVCTISSLVAILVIVIVTVIVCRRYRPKPANRTRSRRPLNEQAPIQTISNFMYEGMGENLNGTTVPTLKPPPYSPAADPPTYDEVFSHSSTDNNTRNENLPAQPPEYESLR